MLIRNYCHGSNTESIPQGIFRTRGLTRHWNRRNMCSHKGVGIIWRHGPSCRARSCHPQPHLQPPPWDMFQLTLLEGEVSWRKHLVSLLAKGTRKEALISTVRSRSGASTPLQHHSPCWHVGSAFRRSGRIQPVPFLKFVCGSCCLFRVPSYPLAGKTSHWFLAHFLSHIHISVFSTLSCMWLSAWFLINKLAEAKQVPERLVLVS